MTNDLDPLLIVAEMRQLLGEFPWLEPDVVKGLYFRLLRSTAAVPDHDEARRYFETIALHLSNAELRVHLARDAQRRADAIDPEDPASRPPGAAGRGRRQSLDGQEPGLPGTADLLARAVGRGAPEQIVPPTLAAPARPRRARGLAHPRAAFERALVEAVNSDESRLSKTAIATRMGVDRKTLNRYIEDDLIPPPPWESLAADLSGTSHPVVPR